MPPPVPAFLIRSISIFQSFVFGQSQTCIAVWLVLTCYAFPLTTYSQETFYGTNQYVEYQAGTLPIILSVPHGGQLQPTTMPDRSCPNVVTATDLNTIETALAIKQALFILTGCYPHIVICHLKRTKLDCNRNLDEGACQNVQAEIAWKEFHHFLTTARNTANSLYDNQAFLVDVHGHGHPKARIELGYLLDTKELALSDEKLNTTAYINTSSIKKLALKNASGSTHSQLLRGNNALGTLLANKNYPSVPSQQIPGPDPEDDFFSGGYITVHHTGYADSVANNGVQMELNYTGIRNTLANRSRFGQQFAEAIITYFNTHFQIPWLSCQPASNLAEIAELVTEVFPNPVKAGQAVQLRNYPDQTARFTVSNVMGQMMCEGYVSTNSPELEIPYLPAGLYLLTLTEKEFGKRRQIKLMIE